MLEKIDKFIEKFLKWKVLKNIILAQLFIIPHSVLASFYNISGIHLIIMNVCFGTAISFFTKAIFEFTKREESL